MRAGIWYKKRLPTMVVRILTAAWYAYTACVLYFRNSRIYFTIDHAPLIPSATCPVVLGCCRAW